MSLKNDQGKPNAGLLEHELFLYQTMVNAAVEPITLIDRNYTYRIVNEAYIQARNLKREEVLNHSVADREVYISTSIGIALYPDNGDTVETLIKNADTAMYRAKEAGKNTFEYYSSKLR